MLFLKLFHGIKNTFIVKPHAVDNRLVIPQTEQPFFGISWLRLGCHRSYFHKAKAKIGKFVVQFGILIKTGGKTHRIFEFYSKYLTLQSAVVYDKYFSEQPAQSQYGKEFDGPKRKVVNGLGVKQKKYRANQVFVHSNRILHKNKNSSNSSCHFGQFSSTDLLM